MSRAVRLAIVTFSLIIIAACNGDAEVGVRSDSTEPTPNSEAAADARAQDMCATEGLEIAKEYGSSKLAAAHGTTPEALRRWETTPDPDGAYNDPAPRTSPDATFVALCYFSGEFSAFPGPPPASDGAHEERPPYDLLGFVIDDKGTATVIVAGYADKLNYIEDAPRAS